MPCYYHGLHLSDKWQIDIERGNKLKYDRLCLRETLISMQVWHYRKMSLAILLKNLCSLPFLLLLLWSITMGNSRQPEQVIISLCLLSFFFFFVSFRERGANWETCSKLQIPRSTHLEIHRPRGWDSNLKPHLLGREAWQLEQWQFT